MSFPFQVLGHDAECPFQMIPVPYVPVRQLRTAIYGPSCISPCKSFIPIHFLQAEPAVPPQKSRDGAFIFLRGKGTGGVDHTAARTEHGRGIVKNLCLAPGAHPYMGLAPLLPGSLVLAEHAFAGTRCVHHNLVKERLEMGRQAFRVLIGYNTVLDTHALHVLGQDFCPGRMDFVGQKESPALQP